MSRYRIGVDIGGTFTDFVMVDRETGRLFNERVLTTPHDPSRAVIDGVGRLLREPSNDCFVHGSGAYLGIFWRG